MWTDDRIHGFRLQRQDAELNRERKDILNKLERVKAANRSV